MDRKLVSSPTNLCFNALLKGHSSALLHPHRRAFRKKSHSLPVVEVPLRIRSLATAIIMANETAVEKEHRRGRVDSAATEGELEGKEVAEGNNAVESSATSLSPLTPVTPLSPEDMSPLHTMALENAIAENQMICNSNFSSEIAESIWMRHPLFQMRANGQKQKIPETPNAPHSELVDDSTFANSTNQVAARSVNANSLADEFAICGDKLGVLLETDIDSGSVTLETSIDGHDVQRSVTRGDEVGKVADKEADETLANHVDSSTGKGATRSSEETTAAVKIWKDEEFESQLTEEEKRIIFV